MPRRIDTHASQLIDDAEGLLYVPFGDVGKVVERLDDRYGILTPGPGLRPREQTDACLAKCETNQCGLLKLNDFLKQRVCANTTIAGGCEPLEAWLDFLTDDQQWCEHWGPKPRKL